MSASPPTRPLAGHDATPWRWLLACGLTGLFLGVAFPYVRGSTWLLWGERILLASRQGWVDASTLLTAGAFAVVGGSAVFAFPRARLPGLLAALLLFGVANEAWQAGFLTRHAQAGDVAAAWLGAVLGVGSARRLPALAPKGRLAAGALAVALALSFAAVLTLAAHRSEQKTRRFGIDPPGGHFQAQIDARGGDVRRYAWQTSVPWHTPERVLGRPDGKRGLPLGATMGLVAGLAGAGLGRTPGGRVRGALAAAAPPFAATVGALWAWDTHWQGIPAGITLGAALAGTLAWALPPGRRRAA